MYYNAIALVLLTAITPAVNSMYIAPVNIQYDDMADTLPIVLKPQAKTLMYALRNTNIQVIQHPEHGKLFGTFEKLIKLMQRREGFTTGKPLKPGAINLLAKHAARGLGKYLTVLGSHLDAPTATVVTALLTNLQQAFVHLESFIKTNSDADKTLISKHIGAIAQELVQLIDVEASGKPYLEILRQINRALPLIIEELRQGIADNRIKPTITTQIVPAPIAQYLMPEALNLANALHAYSQNEWLDIAGELNLAYSICTELDETISGSKAIAFLLELLPTVAYQVGTYLTEEQGNIFIQLLQDIYNIGTQTELCIANGNSLAKQLMFSNCSKLIQDACMHFRLPALPVAALPLLKACNLELPVLVKQFNNGVARAKR